LVKTVVNGVGVEGLVKAYLWGEANIVDLKYGFGMENF